MKKLYKSNQDKMIDGVCAGIAQYFDSDPTLIRLAWIFFCAIGGSGFIAYILAACLIPREPNLINRF
ncbi:MAG: PspC domain-containing protein [Traorella sp.]